MKRRIIALALCVLALVSVLPPGAAAGTEATFVVEAPETLPAVGEEFTVTVKLENCSEFGMVQFSLGFDRDALTCMGIEQGEMMSETYSASNPNNAKGATYASASPEEIEGNGVLVEITFRVDKSVDSFQGEMNKVILCHLDETDIPYTVDYVSVAEETKPSIKPDPKPSQKPDDPQPSEKPEDKPDPEPTQKPEPEPESVTFTDLAGHWGKDFAEKAAQAGLFKGYADGSFRPDEAVSRAQFVTVLWRMAGAPAEERETPFTDIADQYIDFRKAIAWGYHQGYAKGTGEDTFSPDSTLTRQEAMTILFRYAGEQSGMELMFTSIYDSQFQDSADIAPWAKSAMYWGVYHELIQGTGGGALSPTGTASRVQIAKIMTQYQGNLRKEEQ